MKRKYTITDRIVTQVSGILAGLVLLALTAWGIKCLWEQAVYEETNDAQVQEYINPVIARSGGFLVAVRFEENEYVKKGDTLLLIDNQEYVLQQEQTEAAIQKDKAQLLVLESTIHTLEKTAQASKSAVSASKAKRWKQQLDYERYRELVKEESATQQKLEEVQAAFEITNNDYQAAEDQYAASLSKITDARTEKEVVLADLQRLEALLERHRLDVGYTVVRAAYDGRMGRRTVEAGQMIDAGQVLAYIVNNETDKWVVANYKETQIEDMAVGDSVRIVADAYPNRSFSGTVISLSPATGSSFSLLPPDNSTGNYVKIVQRIPVRIRVNGDRKALDLLKAGMNVNVFIPKKQRHG